MDRFKTKQSTTLPVNLITIAVLYQLLMFLGGSILLVILIPADEVLDMLAVEAKIYGCISDGDFILDDGHEF